MLQPEQEFCQQNGPERGPRLFEWQMSFFRVRGYCIMLTNMKAMSICLFYFFEDILLMQFFLNIQRKADYPRPM